MKKAHQKNISRILTSASLWGFGFFAVFGIALGTYAISYPVTQPNPVSGVVGLFVGATSNAYDGIAMMSYATANAECEKEYDYSHICTPMEMINTLNHNPAALQGIAQSFWLNSGNPGNLEMTNNDCRGWTSKSRNVFGSVWSGAKRQNLMTSCDLSRKYACCK